MYLVHNIVQNCVMWQKTPIYFDPSNYLLLPHDKQNVTIDIYFYPKVLHDSTVYFYPKNFGIIGSVCPGIELVHLQTNVRHDNGFDKVTLNK